LGFAALCVLSAMCVGGGAAWCWTQLARLLSLEGPMCLPLRDAARQTWRLLLHGGWGDPAAALPAASERTAAPGLGWYLAAVLLAGLLAGAALLRARRLLGAWTAGSPLGRGQRSLARRALDRGWVTQRTWAAAWDLRRLWVAGVVPGRPYLGWLEGRRRRMLAAELEVQPLVVAPPRAGKTSGFVIPWLLEHDGPALVLSTKRDVYDATVAHRRALGRVWVYDPFGSERSAGFSPLAAATTWSGAIRTGEALASAAHADASNAANEFWDKEAASMLAPLLHAAAIGGRAITEVVRALDTRDFSAAVEALKAANALAAADQLEGVSRRDERNRETTVMSALNLLRAYRYPQVADAAGGDLTPTAFLAGRANTVYVVAAGHDQDALRPLILALVTAVYEAGIARSRESGILDPRLFVLLDEAANIAPVRNLASWLSQCGDHGVVIATIWQSLAQIDQRYGRPARDAICAASTAQVFLPPLADPTTVGYLTRLLGEELTANAQLAGGRRTLAAGTEQAAPAPWLRQIARGRALLIYRDLPPAVVLAPSWRRQRRLRAAVAPSTAELKRAPRVSAWPRRGRGGQRAQWKRERSELDGRR
jgi:type IV secretory pathway TraG/TraD family ATPase VirD4